MNIELHSNIVTSLGAIRGDVVDHLVGVSRYRALRNIDQTMVDIAEFQDLVTPLRDVREQIERQLQETREYRALRAIDSIVPQLADVLAFLDENSNAEMSSPGTEPATPEPEPDATATVESGSETPSHTQIRAVYTRADKKEATDAFADTASETQIHVANLENGEEHSTVQPEAIPEPSDLQTAFATDGSSDDVAGLPPIPDTADDNRSGPDSLSEETASPPVAMLVQSLPPPTHDANTHDANDALADSEEDLATAVNFDHAAREGRAA